MLTIICGEDSVASRNYFLEQKKIFQANDCEVYDVDAKNIDDALNWISDTPSLFSTKKVFFTRSLNKNYSKKSNPKQVTLVEDVIKSKSINLYDWEEETPARFLKITGATVKEFKLHDTVFKLVDSCYPGNIKVFTENMHKVAETNDEIFLFIMLSRHIRNLMLVSLGQTPAGLFSWQAAKLKGQVDRWETDKLVSFYDNLHKIDVSLKSGALPYSLLSALDIMAGYYL